MAHASCTIRAAFSGKQPWQVRRTCFSVSEAGNATPSVTGIQFSRLQETGSLFTTDFYKKSWSPLVPWSKLLSPGGEKLINRRRSNRVLSLTCFSIRGKDLITRFRSVFAARDRSNLFNRSRKIQLVFPRCSASVRFPYQLLSVSKSFGPDNGTVAQSTNEGDTSRPRDAIKKPVAQLVFVHGERKFRFRSDALRAPVYEQSRWNCSFNPEGTFICLPMPRIGSRNRSKNSAIRSIAYVLLFCLSFSFSLCFSLKSNRSVRFHRGSLKVRGEV